MDENDLAVVDLSLGEYFNTEIRWLFQSNDSTRGCLNVVYQLVWRGVHIVCAQCFACDFCFFTNKELHRKGIGGEGEYKM